MSGERLPEIGARFRKMRVDAMTGQKLGYATYTVIAIEPQLSHLPRRVALECEAGRVARPDLANLWGRDWQAVENVIPLHRA